MSWDGKARGRGRTAHSPGAMNKTEERYASVLEQRRLAGEISWWGFEPLKLRLAKATFYSPDFMVLDGDGLVEMHEVKGHWEDDARVKIKVAAERFPMFRFVAVSQVHGGWKYEEV